MTDTTIQVLLYSLPPTITAIATLIVGIRNGRKATVVEQKVDIVSQQTSIAEEKADAAVKNADAAVELANKKADEIHGKVNGNLSEVRADLKIASDRVAKLEILLNGKLDKFLNGTVAKKP